MTRHGIGSGPTARLLLLLAGLLLVACGDDDSSSDGTDASLSGDGGALDDGGPLDEDAAALELTTLQLDSEGACRMDVDCAETLHCFQGSCVFECDADGDCRDGDTCSTRRRCEVAQQDGVGTSTLAATPEVVPGVGLVQPPVPVIRVEPGQDEITITVETTAEVPGGVVGYTIETYSHSSREVQLPTQLFRAEGTDSFDLLIPTTTANPESETPGVVEVQVETSVGSFRTRLQPLPMPSGRYGGTVTVGRFGQIGLPIDFEIVTDPIDATLEAAENVYLVLPVRAGNVFTPIALDPAAMIDAVSVELTFQEFDQKWIGTTRSVFDFTAGSMLARYAAGSVIRGLRFELQLDGAILTGTLRDSWEGLYDARTADGVGSAATVVFDGKLDASRLAAPRALEDLPEAATQVTTVAQAQPLPDVAGACADGQFAVADVTVGSATATCTGITNAAGFALRDAAAQTSCAIAVAETALLSGNTTANLIAAFLAGDTAVTGAESFAEFMARCAAGTDGACRPSAEVLCGRALTAHAAATQGAPDANFPALVDAYTRVTREAFLGRQLAAFQSDADTRLTWLQTQDYPAIVTSAVRDLNEQLIEDWRASVLEAHFGAVSGQYDLAGLTVLARQMQGQAPIDARQLLLSEMTQSWRGAMEALTVAVRRWNDVYQDTASRDESATFVGGRAFDLYVLGGVVDQLNVAAGSSYASSGLAAGFASLLDELRRLALPFSALIFARDAEVVVSRSLDPLSTDDTLLSDIRDAAMAELDRATDSVNGILERAQQMAVDEQLLRDDLNNQVDQAFDELVSLCGFPEGCDDSDRELPECWPRVAAGECGFGTAVENIGTAEVPELTVTVVDYTSSSNISDAGEAILQVVQAADALDGSRSALSDYYTVTSQLQTTYDELEAKFLENVAFADDSSMMIEDLFEEIEEMAQTDYDRQLGEWYDDLVMMRSMALAERRTKATELKTMRMNAREEDIRFLRATTALRQGADSLRAIADRAETITNIVVAGLPKSVDDFSAPARLAVSMTTNGVTTGMNIAAEVMTITSEIVAVEREAASQLNADNLANAELDTELAVQMRENDIANFEAMVATEMAQGAIWEAKQRDIIAALKYQTQLDREIDRDYALLADRRDALFARIVEERDRQVEIHQAEFTLQQRQAAYLRIVQRGQLLDGRLRNLVAQRDQLNLNLGSPSVVFGWANQLEQAESRLERAKDKLMNWIVALEYLAVRPFMDARLQILLARNTYQLAEIAAALDDIQSRCGGAINTNTSIISLRDDVMRLDTNLHDPASDTELSPAQTFREILERGAIPVDKRLRFSSDATIGDLVSRSDVWAATFDLGLSDFANLEASCNAKVQDIAIQLVGDDLGNADPTVALAYDGASSVRSCQPDIEAIVDVIGRDATAFADVTIFKAAGRVLAPVAGINEFGAENQTLVGLPLASQYTVIIDPTLGENASINWTNLEDVRIRVTYGYQDFFPEGQCY